MFKALKSLGVRLSLDDFGTGYSALGYLRSAPFDKIKIDQSFVREATQPKSRNCAIIAAIVALAEALGMETTAEGVEYMDQLDLIRGLRVSHAQGWVYSKAICNDDLVARLTKGDWAFEPSGPARVRMERQRTYKKVGVIEGGCYRQAVVKNVSESGALIEGLAGLSLNQLVIVDFGDGQLAFARVRRLHGAQTGIAFEQNLIADGNGGLCTSHRISQYVLSRLRLPTSLDSAVSDGGADPFPAYEELAAAMGLTLVRASQGQAAALPNPGAASAATLIPTFRQLSAAYMEGLKDDEPSREVVKRDLRNHVLPRFGQLRLNQVSQADIFAWLAAKVEVENQPPGTENRLFDLLSQIWALASRLDVPGALPNPFEGHSWPRRQAACDANITIEEAFALIEAAKTSMNRQLPMIVSLMILTGARQSDVLNARWEEFDLDRSTWNMGSRFHNKQRQMHLSPAAIRLLSQISRSDHSRYVLANPQTGRPYLTIHRSWEVARDKANLPYLAIDDLRHCDFDDAQLQERLVELGLTDPGKSVE
jgi:integrase